MVVMGDLKAAKTAQMGHDAVIIGGKAALENGARMEGRLQETFFDLSWLKDWLQQCVLKLRLLSSWSGWLGLEPFSSPCICSSPRLFRAPPKPALSN